jgi:glycosyltransferase involved in cell wall biosynthesis
MVARIDEIKDHETLLRAFAIAYDSGRGPDAQLWVVGDGVRRPALEALAAVLGISARVRFLGTRSDISEVLGQTDIFAFSTTPNEGFGIALIEAMSAELPIVATDVPACREVLGDGEAGILVAPQDAQALANALRELLSSDSKRAAWGIRALSRVQREYGIADCARQWYQLLDCGEERQPPK